MNIQMPYDNNELNVQYLLAKNQEVNTTSSMLIVCFLGVGCLFYTLSESIIRRYRKKLLKANVIITLIKKIHNLDLDLNDCDTLILKLEKQLIDKELQDISSESGSGSDSESGSGSDSASGSESNSGSGSDTGQKNTPQNETINLSVRLNESGRRIIRSNTNYNNLNIKGKGWKLE